MFARLVGAVARVTVGLAAPAAADQWSKTYPVPGAADLWMKTSDGGVRIEAWDRQEIEARLETVGYTIDKDFELIESQTGSRVAIEAKFPSMTVNLGIGRRSLAFVLRVPRETKLDINTGDGSVHVAGVKGDLRLHSGDGSIEGTDLDGRLNATTGDGGIRVAGRFDGLDVRTGDGGVEASAKPGSAAASAWSVSTGDGGVTLRLPDGFKAELSADTGDGSITMNVPLTMSGSVSRSHVKGTLGGGGGSIRIHTGDGSIRVDRY